MYKRQTTNAPQSFFSDARLKEDIKRVGTAKNGLPIYTFKYKGDDTEQTHIGYIAQDVEKVHPEAVGESHGYKTVDYNKASEPVHRAFGGINFNPASGIMGGGDKNSQDPSILPAVGAGEHGGLGGEGIQGGHGGFGFSDMGGEQASKRSDGAWKRGGGITLSSEGGVVSPEHMREGYFDGGDVVSPTDLSAILASQQQSYAPFEKSGIYGGSATGTPGGKGIVPAANLPVPHLAVANPARTQQGETLMGDVEQVENIGDKIEKANQYRKNIIGRPAAPAQAAIPANPKTGAAAVAAVPAQDATGLEWLKTLGQPQGQAHGGVVGYAAGGGVEPYQTDDPMSQVVSDTEKDKGRQLMTAQGPTGQGSSTFGDISKIVGAGETAANIGSGIASALPFILAPIGLKDGGVAGREHHDGTEGNIVGGGSEQGDNVVGATGPQLPNNPNYYKARALEIAKKTGISPEDFVKLGTGESGFRPHSSDDNSSAGVMQNHIGGASTQYPHGGRGDEYIAAHNPELAKTGSIGDKLAYLNAPSTQIPQMEDAAQYIKEHGAKPWTVARQQGLFGTEADLPAVNAAPAQAVTSPQGGIVAPDGSTPKKSLGDTLMSEQYLIPLLSGLGTMAGSNSRYLGAAILQGIGGGATAYENVQKNIAERGLTGAQTEQQQAITRGEDIANLQRSLQPTPTGNILWLADGTPMESSEYIRRQKAGEKLPKIIGMAGNKMVTPAEGQPEGVAATEAAPVGGTPAGTATTAPVQPTYGYSDVSKKYAQSEPSTALEGGMQSQAILKRGQDYAENVNANMIGARENAQNIAAGAANLAKTVDKTGILDVPGYAYNVRSQIAAAGNTIARKLGKGGNYFGESDTVGDVQGKLNTLSGLASTIKGGQESQRSLDALINANPNAAQNPEAFAELTSKLMTGNQRSIDQGKHLDLYGRDSGQRFSNASTAFESEMPVSKYQTEANAIKQLMLENPQEFAAALNGKVSPTEINKAFKQGFGLDNMSRYFTGGAQ